MSEEIKKNLIFIEINDKIDISTFSCESHELNEEVKELVCEYGLPFSY